MEPWNRTIDRKLMSLQPIYSSLEAEYLRTKYYLQYPHTTLRAASRRIFEASVRDASGDGVPHPGRAVRTLV